jgi:SAM-dependent methyltransferase
VTSHEIAIRARSVLDRDSSAQYRDSDELEVQTDDHKRLCKTLTQISVSFDNPITALDLGCGTGRYFHCLQNVETLAAVDLSLAMLKQARFPVRGEAVTIARIHLVCADVLEVHLTAHFDFIYSIGVFGEFVPWDLFTCNRLFDALKPGGKLFFTVVDVFSKYPYMSKKRRIAETVNLILPSLYKRKLRARLGTFYMTDGELINIFKRSKFEKFQISRHVSTARLWKGAHYECLAAK